MNQQFASKTICEYSFALPFFFFPQSDLLSDTEYKHRIGSVKETGSKTSYLANNESNDLVLLWGSLCWL